MVHPVQSVVESLYAAGRCPRLHVNATCEGVVVPDFIREQWKERLIIDLDSTYPLDLSFSEEGIGVDLSFGGYVTRCNFPWLAIYVVADRATGRGIVIDKNMPESVRRSRQPPIAGPLPADGDLSSTFEHERAHDRRVGGPSKRKRRKSQQPTAVASPTPLSAASFSVGEGDEGDEGDEDELDVAAEVSSETAAPIEQEAQRRRAAFKVIDGGS